MQMTSLKSKFIRWIIGNKEKQSSSIGNRQIILLSRTGEIDFKVEGPWNAEKYFRPTGKIFEF